jgi:hypothetical protein
LSEITILRVVFIDLQSLSYLANIGATVLQVVLGS